MSGFAPDPKSIRKFPVVEAFGPTIQGEGIDAGETSYFIRFGGCDFQCSWCDSLHAVLPEHVRQAERLTIIDIVDRLLALPNPPTPGAVIVLSGGNPALHELAPLVCIAHERGWRVSIETQGTRWKDWIATVDTVMVSPKPPSSGMVQTVESVTSFMEHLAAHPNVGIKVVVGDDDDYEFAVKMHEAFPRLPFFVSVLNAAGSDADAFDLLDVLGRYRSLCERVSTDARMNGVKVFPQMHTLAWGAEVGR